MNYRRVYMKIIMNAKKEVQKGNRPDNPSHSRRKKFNGMYFEFHHILPRSLFPLWENKEENIIALTAREHFFCHQLLLKIYPSSEMAYAIFFMSTGRNKEKYKITSREYEIIRKLNSENRKGKKPNNFGIPMSEEAKRKMMESRAKTIAKMTENERKEAFGNHRSYKGNQNPFYGKTFTEEQLNKMKKTKKENLAKLTPEERKKLLGKGGEKRKGKNNPRARACILINTGEYFETIQEARNKYPMARHIPEACKANGGVAGSINGEKLRWKYAD